jgi:hypothetical protein
MMLNYSVAMNHKLPEVDSALSSYPSHIVSIVPRLPPAIDGVGDNALILARQLKKDYGIFTHFIVGDPSWAGPDYVEGFPVHKLSQRISEDLFHILHRISPYSSTVLLHMSGYGYAKWAVCNWLVDGLSQWRQNQPNAKLVTMFHELYNCMGRPWQHNFWVANAQKQIAKKLACLTDHAITNCREYALDLVNLSRGKHRNVPFMPVVSTVGEPTEVKSLVDRKSQMVLFGLASNRISVYKRSRQQIEEVCQYLNIERIVDIGAPTGLDLAYWFTVPVVEMGKLPAPQISEILGESMVGWLEYDVLRLGKSSIFSAYSAHRLLPIVKSHHVKVDNDVSPRFISPEAIFRESDISSFQKIADDAYLAYQEHCQTKQIGTFVNFLTGKAVMA